MNGNPSPNPIIRSVITTPSHPPTTQQSAISDDLKVVIVGTQEAANEYLSALKNTFPEARIVESHPLNQEVRTLRKTEPSRSRVVDPRTTAFNAKGMQRLLAPGRVSSASSPTRHPTHEIPKGEVSPASNKKTPTALVGDTAFNDALDGKRLPALLSPIQQRTNNAVLKHIPDSLAPATSVQSLRNRTTPVEHVASSNRLTSSSVASSPAESPRLTEPRSPPSRKGLPLTEYNRAVEAFKQNEALWKDLEIKWKKEEKFALLALKKGTSFEEVSKDYPYPKALALEALKQGYSFDKLPPDLQNIEEIRNKNAALRDGRKPGHPSL